MVDVVRKDPSKTRSGTEREFKAKGCQRKKAVVTCEEAQVKNLLT